MFRAAVVLVILALTSPCAMAPAAAQERRVAVVVGIGAYRAVPALPNPPRDARSVAAALRGLGFQVELVLDPDRPGLERAIRTLGNAARTAEVALFFYAGHAVEFGGHNYLVPTTANIQGGRDLPFETVDLDLLATQVEGSVRTSLIFLDACRDNPFALRLSGGDRGVAGRGLAAPASASTGTLIVYATAPGRTRPQLHSPALSQHGVRRHLRLEQQLLDALICQHQAAERSPFAAQALCLMLHLLPVRVSRRGGIG